jgi:hypothetical protein
MARQDLEFIAEALGGAVESARQSVRLRHGLRLRAAMLDALSKSEPFTHYRLTWMSQSIDKVLEYAKTLCRDFDKEHPDDMASALDLADMCRGATNMVEGTLMGVKTDEKPQT